MKNIKSYEDFTNEEINIKKTLAGVALGASLLGGMTSCKKSEREPNKIEQSVPTPTRLDLTGKVKVQISKDSIILNNLIDRDILLKTDSTDWVYISFWVDENGDGSQIKDTISGNDFLETFFLDVNATDRKFAFNIGNNAGPAGPPDFFSKGSTVLSKIPKNGLPLFRSSDGPKYKRMVDFLNKYPNLCFNLEIQYSSKVGDKSVTPILSYHEKIGNLIK